MKNYWINFYKSKRITNRPSSFAKFVKKYINKDKLSVYCLGAGNGRDSYYLSKKWNLIGIDYASDLESRDNMIFVNMDVKEFIKMKEFKADMIYARFFFHHIDNELFNDILKWGKGLIAFEVRSKKDEELKKTFEHHRYYRTGKEITEMLDRNSYELMYFNESRGISKFKGEDPWIIRVIAKKI